MKNKLFETNTLKINDLMLLGEKYLLDHGATIFSTGTLFEVKE